MGKTATAFKDIGKACSDLLTKDYKVGKSTVEVKSKTSNGVTFTPSGTKSGDKFSGSLAAKYEFLGGLSSEVTLLTSGVVEATLEGSPMKDLTVTLDCERPEPSKPGLLAAAKCTLDYKKEAFTAKAAYGFYDGALACAGSYVYDALTLGCSADYSTTKSALSKYGGACQFVQPDFSIIAKLAASAGKSPTYTGMYYHKVSSDMQVGAELTHASGKEIGLAFGCQYKLDKDTTVKGKVDADGMLYSSYKQKLSPIATMTLAAQIDTVNLSENKHKFGMVLNVTA
jgi:voltage-dependent anion channel protein 2